MSVIDNAIQQLFTNGCKIKKLWANASPTSQFAAQKITLSMTNYDAVLVEFESSYSALTGEYCRVSFKGTEDWTDTFANAQNERVLEIRTRQYSASDTGINFQQGYGKSVSSASVSVRNDYAIPLTVYGIQLLGGG